MDVISTAKSPACARCGNPIGTSSIIEGDRYWHPECHSSFSDSASRAFYAAPTMRKEEQPIVERLTFHKQLFRHDPENDQWGDCARTCIACLLGLAPGDVPHEHRDMTSAEHNALYDAFLHERGITRVWIGFKAETVAEAVDWASQWSNGLPFILSGESPRGTNHVVLGREGKIIHDPHPDGGDIVGPMDNGLFYVEWLVSPASTIEALNLQISHLVSTQENMAKVHEELRAEIERLKGYPGEPELTCPHIDILLERTNIPAEVRSELAAIRDINSQLRYGLWHEKQRATTSESEVSVLRKRVEELEEALGDLLTWFPDQPSEPEWRLKAGSSGADDAIAHARTLTEGGKDG